MSGTKLFSIITVVKDDPEGFAASLNSLEEQTHRDFEFVVIDSSRDPGAVTQILEDSGLNGVYFIGGLLPIFFNISAE